MEDRVILHSDLNSFYASVEMMLNPSLRGKAVAVCGSTEDRHGIVLAKSDLAKKTGIKTGMVNWEARQLCKDLIVVPPHYDQYLKYSKMTQAIYQRYTDLMEPFGMDECWLDVTGSKLYGSGMEIAEQIRQACREELGLTVSIGVSYNKIFAKLGSDMKKPDAIMLDMTMVRQAIACDDQFKRTHMEQARSVTGLENPNSPAQLKEWLAERGVEVESLSKAAVLQMLEEADGEVELALSLRQELAKSSVKKYTAIGRSRNHLRFRLGK